MFSHGYTFPLTPPEGDKGKYSLVGSSVGKYMKANGYEKVGYDYILAGGASDEKNVKENDVMIFFKADGTSCVHSCIVKSVVFKGNVIDIDKSFVKTKNGVRPVDENQSFNTVIGTYIPDSAGAARKFEYYRKK